MQSVTTYSENVQEISIQILEAEEVSKKEVRIEQKGSVFESILYLKNVVEVMKRQIEMCTRETGMQARTAEKEKMLHPVDTSFFRTVEGIVRQGELRTSAD